MFGDPRLGRGLRVGFGYDSHRFDEARPLVLGGVRIPKHPGLRGHSDGDAVVHAIIDALLGAAALGDIGRHFPPSEPRWKDADSMELLASVVELLAQSDLRVCNVDVTVITERPSIAASAPQMVTSLSAALGTTHEAISIKGKTNEGMGWIGAGEGMAVHAVALLEGKPDDGVPQST